MHIVLLEDQGEVPYKREVSLGACNQSGLIKELLVDQDLSEEIELPLDIASAALADKVVEFLEFHANNPMRTIEKPIKSSNMAEIVDAFDVDYISVDHATLVQIILAANYLNCMPLLELGLLRIATMIKDKEPDEVKDMFNISKSITPEEECRIREQNLWIFELAAPKRVVSTTSVAGEEEHLEEVE